MDNTDLFDKILKSMSTIIKKPIIISNIKNASKIIGTVGVFCVTNLFFQLFCNFKLNKIVENQDTVIEQQNVFQTRVLNELDIIYNNKEKTNEILLSLLKLNDNLFSDLRLIVNFMKNIHQEIGEINEKIDVFDKVEISSESDGDITASDTVTIENITVDSPTVDSLTIDSLTIDTTLADSIIDEFLTPTSVGSYDIR